MPVEPVTFIDGQLVAVHHQEVFGSGRVVRRNPDGTYAVDLHLWGVPCKLNVPAESMTALPGVPT